MSDDIQLQRAIYESYRSSSSSSGSSSFRTSSGGGGGGFGRSSFRSSSLSASSGGSASYLRNSVRHGGHQASSFRRGGSGASKAPTVSRSRSSVLKKEGILPARKSSSSTSSVTGGVAGKYARSDVNSAVLDSLSKRFGGVGTSELNRNHHEGSASTSSLAGASRQAKAPPSSSSSSSFWQKVTGNGRFTWQRCQPEVANEKTSGSRYQTRGSIDSTSGSNKHCIIRYCPKKDTDPLAFEALHNQAGQETQCLSISMSFKCAHAAPASGHVPAFQLLVFNKTLSKDRMQALAMVVDTKERLFALELIEMREDLATNSSGEGSTRSSRIRTLHTIAFRELRPGVFNTLVFECNLSGGGLTIQQLRCNDVCVAESLVIQDKWFESGETKAHPMLGLGVSKSKLEWDEMELTSVSQGSASRSVARFRHSDMSLVQVIEEEMLEIENPITFDDIASLKGAKELLNEAVTLPLLIPEFFVGIREPWKGVLLFGPPGTGKTLLAKAVASMSEIRFFNCSSSAMTSKWRGESEKLCKVLFQMARHYAPSIIFFDEVDAQVSQRGQDGEHEASRRFKSELLSQMDGITSSDNSNGKNVIVLATTNCPWDVDEAMRRRLEKRIYIPLPDREARREMFKIYLSTLVLSKGVDIDGLVQSTEGFSGADIKLLCRDASMMPMRRAILNKSPEQIRQMKIDGELQNEKQPLLQEDFTKALAKIQPSVSADTVKKYEEWEKEFASV